MPGVALASRRQLASLTRRMRGQRQDTRRGQWQRVMGAMLTALLAGAPALLPAFGTAALW